MTGGGEVDEISMDAILSKLIDITVWEKKVVQMIGVTGLVGIFGGIDTSIEQAVTVENDELFEGNSNEIEPEAIHLRSNSTFHPTEGVNNFKYFFSLDIQKRWNSPPIKEELKKDAMEAKNKLALNFSN